MTEFCDPFMYADDAKIFLSLGEAVVGEFVIRNHAFNDDSMSVLLAIFFVDSGFGLLTTNYKQNKLREKYK